MISDDTRPVLAPLHERRKRSLPSQIVQLFVLATACSVFLSNSDFVTFICTMIIGKSVSGSMTVAPLLFTFERSGRGEVERGGAGVANSADDVRRSGVVNVYALGVKLGVPRKSTTRTAYILACR